MTFTLTITCDNAAFVGDVGDSPDVMTAGREVARILQETVTKIRAGYDAGHCYDQNGHRVGDFGFIE